MVCCSRVAYPSETVMEADWGTKNQGDALDYAVALDQFRCDRGEKITRMTVDVTSESGIDLLWTGITERLGIVALQGGNVGEWQITLTLETTMGRRYVRTMSITVLADNGSLDSTTQTPVPPDGAQTEPSNLTLPDGRILTI